LERGSKEGMIRKSPLSIWADSCPQSPCRGRGKRENPSKLLFHFNSLGQAKKRKEPASKLR
jgi:hypothetical protein